MGAFSIAGVRLDPPVENGTTTPQRLAFDGTFLVAFGATTPLPCADTAPAPTIFAQPFRRPPMRFTSRRSCLAAALLTLSASSAAATQEPARDSSARSSPGRT